MAPSKQFIVSAEERPKVLVNSQDVPEIALKMLREKCEVTYCETTGLDELFEKIRGVDGVFWATWAAHNKLDAAVLDAAGPQLRSISTFSAGFDFVDVDELKKRNIPLGCTPNVLNDSVADIAVGLAIAASRRFNEGRLKILSSEWEQRPRFLLGQDLRGSTIGIVGLGGIGQNIVKRLSGFEVGQFLYCGRKQKPEAKKFNAFFVSFDVLLKSSDFIFVCCPLKPETRKLFNKAAFDKMKTTSVLVNVARGDIVDQEALYDALKQGEIFAAGLDVMSPEPLPANHPLLTLPNCIISPHLGANTEKTRNDMAAICAINVLAGLAGKPMHSPAY